MYSFVGSLQSIGSNYIMVIGAEIEIGVPSSISGRFCLVNVTLVLEKT